MIYYYSIATKMIVFKLEKFITLTLVKKKTKKINFKYKYRFNNVSGNRMMLI